MLTALLLTAHPSSCVTHSLISASPLSLMLSEIVHQSFERSTNNLKIMLFPSRNTDPLSSSFMPPTINAPSPRNQRCLNHCQYQSLCPLAVRPSIVCVSNASPNKMLVEKRILFVSVEISTQIEIGFLYCFPRGLLEIHGRVRFADFYAERTTLIKGAQVDALVRLNGATHTHTSTITYEDTPPGRGIVFVSSQGRRYNKKTRDSIIS